MNIRKSLITLAFVLLTITQSGCASMVSFSRIANDSDNTIFHAPQTKPSTCLYPWYPYGGAVTHGVFFTQMVKYTVKEKAWWTPPYMLVALIDLPLSAAMDTLHLPVTVPVQVYQCAKHKIGSRT